MASSGRKRVAVIGAPLSYGADMAGVELGPAVMRMAGLKRRIAELGYEVRDLGDIQVDEASPVIDEKLHHLPEIKAACQRIFDQVEGALNDGDLPVTLGGDHSIAIGSLGGVSSNSKSVTRVDLVRRPCRHEYARDYAVRQHSRYAVGGAARIRHAGID